MSGPGNAKVGIWDPESGDDVEVIDRGLKVSTGGFPTDADVSTTIATSGTVVTVTQTDGAKTLTTEIDYTDVSNITINSAWS